MSKFNPTAAEVAIVNQIFAHADPQKLGVVTGEAAVKVFSGTKLSPSVLAEVWALADEDNNGVLTRKGVAVAVRLLGHAQRGERVTEALVQQPGPVPVIEGFAAPIAQQATGVPTPRSPPLGFPPLTPQDKTKFMKLFIGSGPQSGLLSGDKARDILVKSKLPVDKLSQIWALADTKSRGALDLTDFTIAMYLVQASMAGRLASIPASLPPYLYEQAKGTPDFVASHATGESGSFSPTSSIFPRPISTIQPQYTGQSLHPQTTGNALRPTHTGPALPPRSPFQLTTQHTGQSVPWDITPTEKANADRFFDTLDTQKKGFIDGDTAVPFFTQSKLPDDALAQIWDLSDLNNNGLLTRDGFAVAMHLIQNKLTGKEIPSTLPISLIPPSMRNNFPVVQAPPKPQISEAMRDLLWDDTPPPSTTTAQAPPVPQTQAIGTLSPQHTASPPQVQHSVFGTTDPFSNSYSPFTNAPAPAPAPTFQRNLLDDDDEPAATSPPLQDKSAEIGNTQNQLNSTNRSLETTKAERVNLEQVLADQAAQLSALQTQLSSAKATYETETRLLTALRERFSTQSADIQKTRQELIHAESDLSAVRVEKAEVEGSLLRDKEEARELHRKMVEVGQQVETLKVDVEKAKKDGKQQKGLLAIAKKQLATKEADRARVLAELADAQAEVEATTKELEETEAELAKEDVPQPKVNGVQNLPPSSPDSITIAAAQPLPPSPPDMPSPSGKSNNPFERLAMASGSPRSGSPFLPFADSAVLPTPPTAPVQSDVNDDPFGFSDAFGAPEPAAAPAETDLFGSETFAESAQSATLAPPSEHPDVMSPADTDLFVTPPTSATIDKPSEEPASLDTILQSAAPSDASAEPFSVASPQVPGHFPLDDQAKATSEEHTDLNAQLKELDIEESDSDSDDDEPLANVQTKLAETSSHTTGQDVPSTSAFDDSFGITTSSTPKAESIRVASPIPPAVASVRSQSPALSSHSVPKDIFGSPFTPAPVEQPTPVQPVETPKPNGAAAGVSDFDEAFGKVSSSGPSSHFTFDSAFDDNFDFAAAREAVPTEPVQVAPPRNESLTATSSTFPPAPTGSTSAPKDDSFDAVFLSSSDVDTAPSSAAPAPSTAESKPFSFDDAFGAGPSQPTQLQPVQQSQSNGSIGISFDDAFGGHPSEALALDSLVKPTFQPPPGPPPGHVAQMAFPTVSPPATPHHEVTGNSSSEVRRSMSPPPRQRSPPPRHSSPKPRPSTASSDKEKPTRHSKLSIRLPFGRKKKQEPAPPMPAPISQQQVVEEPTPPAEDDMEAVKTLCGMGFSRTQAVTALERHGYDVQRALNSLLGSA